MKTNIPYNQIVKRELGEGYSVVTEQVGKMTHVNWYDKSGDNCRRGGGPTSVWYYEDDISKSNILISESWKRRGEYHREDGPAIIRWDEKGNLINEKFFLNDKQLDGDELDKLKTIWFFNQLGIGELI